jgi:hypothetical protein
MQAARQAVCILYRCHAIQHKHCVVNHDIQLAVDVDALHDVTHAHTHTGTGTHAFNTLKQAGNCVTIASCVAAPAAAIYLSIYICTWMLCRQT